MRSGTVIFYNMERGLGYIKPENGEKEIRVLSSALKLAGIKRLNKGQKIQFDTHIDPDSGKITVGTIEMD